MKIRDGFVTNSSSTNFLIISKEELTEDYLYHKLGFQDGSPLEESGRQFCAEVLSGTNREVRWFEIDEINYSSILEIFGKESAEKFKQLDKKGFYAYVGYTSSDESHLTIHFTIDSFEIDEKDFYINGRNSAW